MGRGYLLDRIADPTEPMDHRLQLADIVAQAGRYYCGDCQAQGDAQPKPQGDDERALIHIRLLGLHAKVSGS